MLHTQTGMWATATSRRLLENNGGESRRETPSVGGRTKLQLLWRSLCFCLVNGAVHQTLPYPPSTLYRQVISHNELGGCHLAIRSDTFLLQHIQQMLYGQMNGQVCILACATITFALSREMDSIPFQGHCSQSKSRSVL